ncbi:MAG: DNA-3-methyladenine glycosylase I [Rhodothalassiaceae bacterium]
MGLVTGEDGKARCAWGARPAIYRAYHDREWGRPVTDDIRLFEKLSLEGFQAGLSWLTILNKRENFRAAFDGFDFHRIARYRPDDVTRLLADPGIIRHRGKIEAVINNARCALDVIAEAGSLAGFIWQYRPEPRPAPLSSDQLRQISQSPGSVALAKALKARGWRFVGPTTVYAFFQAMGLVNDHGAGCWVQSEVEAAQRAISPPG